MPGTVDAAIWLLSVLLELLVVVFAIRHRMFKKFFFLNLYMLFWALASIGRFEVLAHYGGFRSLTYRYFYFYSDALLGIARFFALMNLFVRLFEDMKVERYVRLAAVLLLSGIACFSVAVVLNQSSERMLTHFVFELGQNLYFVALVLTYVLWGAILKLRETRTVLVQLVLSLGIYLSACTASYSLSNLHVRFFPYINHLVPVMGCLLPLSWAYTFWRVPEDARLAPSRLVASQR